MIALIFRNLFCRPLRASLTLLGIAVAMAVLVCIMAFGEGYQAGLRVELERAGIQLMLVPLGCPYDAALRALKNNSLEASLPSSALDAAQQDPAVAVAAPLLMAALPRPEAKRTDNWVGLDRTALQLKPWWQVVSGSNWFGSANEVILGADAAALEMRQAGDKLFSPETKREFRVAGILQRSGTSDDSAFFVPLGVAQEMFAQRGRLTAVAIRLKEPTLLAAAANRLQKIPGAQVVTMTEMMGTFLNLVGTVRTLVLAIAIITVLISALMVFNTLLAAVLERTSELAVLRAIGASRAQIFGLLLGESVLLTLAGTALGIVLAFAIGPGIESLAKTWLPLTPVKMLLGISIETILRCSLLALCVGACAAVYPAWRASQLPPALATKFS